MKSREKICVCGGGGGVSDNLHKLCPLMSVSYQSLILVGVIDTAHKHDHWVEVFKAEVSE